jgi:hypothetical protein
VATKPEVLALLNNISEAFPSFELTPGRINLYADMLSDLDTDALKAAVKQHIATAKWPPTVAELREMCLTLTRPALPAWTDAWAELLSEIKRVGHWGEPRFSHDLIKQAVEGLGDWQTICAMEISETATWRAQFRQSFEGYAHRATSEAALLPTARALAAKYGAIAAPAEVQPQALPAPVDAPAERGDFIDFAASVRQYREEGRKEREAETRRKLAAWQADQERTVVNG